MRAHQVAILLALVLIVSSCGKYDGVAKSSNSPPHKNSLSDHTTAVLHDDAALFVNGPIRLVVDTPSATQQGRDLASASLRIIVDGKEAVDQQLKDRSMSVLTSKSHVSGYHMVILQGPCLYFDIRNYLVIHVSNVGAVSTLLLEGGFIDSVDRNSDSYEITFQDHSWGSWFSEVTPTISIGVEQDKLALISMCCDGFGEDDLNHMQAEALDLPIGEERSSAIVEAALALLFSGDPVASRKYLAANLPVMRFQGETRRTWSVVVDLFSRNRYFGLYVDKYGPL